ncbi:MAG: SH3 domain-containing protein, partial [Limnobacter sp.]
MKKNNNIMRLKPLAVGLILAGLLPLPAMAQIRADIRSETKPNLVAQVTETVEKVTRKVAGIPEVAELENAERPLVLLQVFDNRSVVYSKPNKESRAIGEFFKGQLVDAYEEKDGWYRVRIQDSLLGGFLGSTDGWVQQGTGQYGEQSLGVFAPRAFSADVLQDKAGTGIRPSSTATPGIVPNTIPQTPQVQRAIPGRDTPIVPRDIAIPVIDPSQVPPPLPNLPRETVAVPDRWRIMQSLGFKFPLFDPYNQNVIKGDLPVLQNTLGPDWFFNLGIIADTLYEQRNFPVPVPPATSSTGGQANIFGDGEQSIFAHNLIVSLSLTKGNTTFKPPDYEFRLTPVFNYTDVRVNEDRLLKIASSSGDVRREGFVGIQEAFVDVHLRNVSDRYDFDSLRVGIQPFISDFRGFLFQDLP